MYNTILQFNLLWEIFLQNFSGLILVNNEKFKILLFICSLAKKIPFMKLHGFFLEFISVQMVDVELLSSLG